MSNWRGNTSRSIDAVVGQPPRTLTGHHPPHHFSQDSFVALTALSDLESKVVRILQSFQDPGGDGAQQSDCFSDDLEAYYSNSSSGGNTSAGGAGSDDGAADPAPIKPQRFSSLVELSCHSGGGWQFTMQVADYIVHVLEGLSKDGEATALEQRRQQKEKAKQQQKQESGDDGMYGYNSGAGTTSSSMLVASTSCDSITGEKLSNNMVALNRCLSFLRDADKDFAAALQHSQVCTEFREFCSQHNNQPSSPTSAAAPAAVAATVGGASTEQQEQKQQNEQREHNKKQQPPHILSQHAFILIFSLLQSICRCSAAVPTAAVHRSVRECNSQRAAMAYSGASTAAMNPSARSVERGAAIPMKFYVEAKASETVGRVSKGTVESAGGHTSSRSPGAATTSSGIAGALPPELMHVPSYAEPLSLYVSKPSPLCNERFTILGRFLDPVPSYPGYQITRRTWLARDTVSEETRVMTLLAAFRPSIASEEVHGDSSCRPACVNHTAAKGAGSPFAQQQRQRLGQQLTYPQLLLGQMMRDKMMQIKYFSRAQMCRHPNLVSTYDVVLDEMVGGVFLSSAHAEHGSLMRLDIEGRSDRSRDICAPRALHFCRQLLDAVGYLHDRGVVHSLAGVSCSDVMLGEDDTVLLKGFGMVDDAVQSVLDELQVIAPIMLATSGTAPAPLGPQQTGAAPPFALDTSAGGGSSDSGDAGNNAAGTAATAAAAAAPKVEVLHRCPRRSPHHDNFSPPVAAAFDHLDAINTYCFRAPEAIRASDLLPLSATAETDRAALKPTDRSNSTMVPASSIDAAESTTTTSALMKRDVFSLGIVFFVMLFGRLPFYLDDYRNSSKPIPPSVAAGTNEQPTVTESIANYLKKVVQCEKTMPPLEGFFDLLSRPAPINTGAAESSSNINSNRSSLVDDMGSTWCRNLKEVPTDFFVLLARMLATDPNERCTAHAALEALDAILASKEYKELTANYSDEFRVLFPRGQRERSRRMKRAQDTVATVLARHIKEEQTAEPYNSDADEDDGTATATTVMSPQTTNTQAMLRTGSGESSGMFPTMSSDDVLGGGMGTMQPTMTPHEGPARTFSSNFASWMAHSQAGVSSPSSSGLMGTPNRDVVAAQVRRSAAAIRQRSDGGSSGLMSRADSVDPASPPMVRASTQGTM